MAGPLCTCDGGGDDCDDNQVDGDFATPPADDDDGNDDVFVLVHDNDEATPPVASGRPARR